MREEFTVSSDPGIEVSVREVTRDEGASSLSVPVILLHSSRAPGVASFDLDVPNGSLAGDLAEKGHPVYVMDARGWGGSTRPAEMSGPSDGDHTLVRSNEVVRDISAVVEAVCERTGAGQVALFGWSVGGSCVGYYASLYPDHVSHLIMHNSLYGGGDGHSALGPGSLYEDPNQPGRFNFGELGRYRFITADELLGMWDWSIPSEDKGEWRDPALVEAYQAAALASDPTSSERTPPSFRCPCGVMEDTFYMASGRLMWDASFIRARTLVTISEFDFWSRPSDRELLAEHLTHAESVEFAVIPQATYYVHLDRPERGRDNFIETLTGFLAS